MSLAEAVLRVKIFHVEVFYSGSLLEPEPDIVEDVRALTEITAVQQVMTIHSVQSVGTVYIVDENNQECWLYDVCLTERGLVYEHCVSSRFGVDRCNEQEDESASSGISPVEGLDGYHNQIGGYSCPNCHDQGCWQCQSWDQLNM